MMRQMFFFNMQKIFGSQMKWISFIFFFTLCSPLLAAENLDSVCRRDEDSNQKSLYSIQKKSTSKEGIVICGSAKSIMDAKNDISVMEYKKNGKSISGATLFESDDELMSYEIKPGKDFFGIRENLAGKSKNDPLFVYGFDCDDGVCGRKLKTCAIQKSTKTGTAVVNLEKDFDKLQKLNKKNNADYERRIRQIFIDAIAGDSPSRDFFKKKKCGWNHYIDIDETCTAYEKIIEETLKHPCH